MNRNEKARNLLFHSKVKEFLSEIVAEGAGEQGDYIGYNFKLKSIYGDWLINLREPEDMGCVVFTRFEQPELLPKDSGYSHTGKHNQFYPCNNKAEVMAAVKQFYNLVNSLVVRILVVSHVN